MAIDEDALNDALNTPTDELDDEPPADDDLLEDEPVADEPPADDEPGDEPDADDLVDVLLGKTKKPEGRVQRLANERRDAEERAEAAERRLKAVEDEMERRAKAVQDDLVARRRAELDEMDPIERRLLENEQEARRARFEAADSRDQQNWRARTDRNPQLRNLEDDVEKELKAARNAGQNPSREAIATYLLGQRAMKALEQGPKVKAAAKKRVEQARGRPMGAGSNVRSGEPQQARTSTSELEKRLSGIKL